jgi:coenzyme F420 hydrogenase subunit beta
MAVFKAQWKELYEEVVTSGLCTGCAACVVVCPHDVLGYNDAGGAYKPFHFGQDGGPTDCTHGQRGCTLCTRACPRFQDWEKEADTLLFQRQRQEDEPEGIVMEALLTKAVDPELNDLGQDGGFVSAALIYCLENNIIDGALVSYVEADGSGWKAVPGVARTKEDVLRAAGSRYTYSANTLAYLDAISAGLERLCLVGMSCQASIPAIMSARKTGKSARRMTLSIGLLCSKTFDDSIFEEFFEEKYGIRRADIKKINIKGVFQIWLKDGSYKEVPLKEGHAWTREGCKMCPDFAAEHADISAGGIGKNSDFTLTLIRTQKGKDLVDKLIGSKVIEAMPASQDPEAILLLKKLSKASRRRWPEFGVTTPGLRVKS